MMSLHALYTSVFSDRGDKVRDKSAHRYAHGVQPSRLRRRVETLPEVGHVIDMGE
jgi:hypothetical protein